MLFIMKGSNTNGQTLPKFAKTAKNSGQEWPKVGQGGQKWSKAAKLRQKWQLVDLLGSTSNSLVDALGRVGFNNAILTGNIGPGFGWPGSEEH